jgi:hypothetical protein
VGPCFNHEEQYDERNEDARIYGRDHSAEQQCAFAVRGWTVFGLVWLLRMVLLLCPVLVQQLLLVLLGTVATTHGVLSGRLELLSKPQICQRKANMGHQPADERISEGRTKSPTHFKIFWEP